MSINHVVLSGNLTREPELKATQGGTDVLMLGIAVNERRKNQAGQWEDVPNYFDLVIFGSRATGLARILHKGMKVAVEGHMRWHQWEHNGQKRSKIDVIVDECDILSPKAAERPQEPMQEQYGTQAVYEDEIPF